MKTSRLTKPDTKSFIERGIAREEISDFEVICLVFCLIKARVKIFFLKIENFRLRATKLFREVFQSV